MNLPNALTLLRIFFVPLFVAALLQQNLAWQLAGVSLSTDLIALACFLIAAATDLLDGYLARRWGQITTVGTLLDPIADKLLISAALIAMVQIRIVPAWMAIVIIGREFAISGLRSIAAAEGYTIPASDLGKSKMILQVFGIALLLGSLHWQELRLYANATMWAVVLLTVVSGFGYFRTFWRKVDSEVKKRRRRELLLLERRRKKAAALGQTTT